MLAIALFPFDISLFRVSILGVRCRTRRRYWHTGRRSFGGWYGLGMGGGARLARRWRFSDIEGFEVDLAMLVSMARTRCEVTKTTWTTAVVSFDASALIDDI